LPAFEKDGDLTFLKLARGTNVYRFPWAMPPHYDGIVPLETNRVYRFSIAELGHPHPSIPSWPYLVSIHDGDERLYEILTFRGEERAGAIIFVDECLTRGLTNAMTVADLRKWATNLVDRYKRLERLPLESEHPIKRFREVPREDVPEPILHMQVRIPCCRFSYKRAPESFMFMEPSRSTPQIEFGRSAAGELATVSISFYNYGIVIGSESYAPWSDVPPWPEAGPWHRRKLADGIFLWHGYK
jgi:hypothetical protein